MIEAALSHIDPTDRDTWVSMAMAIKSELGDSGFEVWDCWSQQASNYKAADARSVWRSVKGFGGVTIGSLFHLAKQNGYQGDVAAYTPRPRDLSRERDERRERERKAAEAAGIAGEIIKASRLRVHPYLGRKGHAHQLVLVCMDYVLFPGTKWEDPINEEIIVPMRDWRTGRVTSVQRIDAGGSKKFLAGGRAKGAVFAMGPTNVETYLCEGFATALSVRAALASLYRRARVVVCFSAANIAHVAQHLGDYVVADHDESGTGAKYAEKSGLPWWMPPRSDTDANDFHVEHGVRALARELNRMRLEAAQKKTAGDATLAV